MYLLIGIVPPTPLSLTCELFLTNVIILRALHCTPLDVALAAEKATKTPTILVFSEMDAAAFDVRVRIEELVESGLWRPVDLLPRFGAVQPQTERIDKDSAVFAVSGAVAHA